MGKDDRMTAFEEAYRYLLPRFALQGVLKRDELDTVYRTRDGIAMSRMLASEAASVMALAERLGGPSARELMEEAFDGQ